MIKKKRVKLIFAIVISTITINAIMLEIQCDGYKNSDVHTEKAKKYETQENTSSEDIILSNETDTGYVEQQHQSEESINKTDDMGKVLVEDIGACNRVYDSWIDFKGEPQLPYVDTETYAIIKSAYSNINFFGEFETGDEEHYEVYKEKYRELLCNKELIIDRDTSTKMLVTEVDGLADYIEAYGIDNMVYYFFDVDGDDFPELCIQYYGMGIYVFDYNEEMEEFSLWYDLASYNYTLIGTQKIMWRDNGKFLAFYELNEKGEEECQTFFWNEPYSEQTNICIVMLPCYKDEQKNVIVTDKIKMQGIYAQSEEHWYFRVTEQQYNELAENYREAYRVATEKIKEVTYTYEELFGSEDCRK